MRYIKSKGGILEPGQIGSSIKMRIEESLINDSSPPAWNPVDAFGTDLWGYWLAEDVQTSGSKVTTYNDLGTLNHDLTNVVTYQPDYNATGSLIGGPIVSHRRVANVGDSLFCLDAGLALPLHFMMCCKWSVTTSADYESAFSSKNNSGNAFMIESWDGIKPVAHPYAYRAGNNISLGDAQWHVFDMYADMSVVKAGIDGAALSVKSVATAFSAVGGFCLGCYETGGRGTDIDIVGAMLVTREMTDDERAEAVTLLKNKAGL